MARSFYRSGVLATTLAMRGQDHRRTNWRTPTTDPADDKVLNWRLDPEVSIGLAGELGIHQVDVMHWFTESYPTTVRGRGNVVANPDGREVADVVHCDFGFDSGLHMSWHGALGSSYGGRYEVLTGSMASLRLGWNAGWMFKEADSPTQGWEVYANREAFAGDEGITLIADATQLAKSGKLQDGVGLPNPPLYYGLSTFATSVLEGNEVACTAAEGLRATAVALAAHRAVVTGEEQAITEDMLKV